jgi:hypothetical protein
MDWTAGVRFPAALFFLATTSRWTAKSTHHPVKQVTGALPTRVKWLECKADHSPPSSAVAKDARS